MRETKKKLLQETVTILKKLDKERLAISRSKAEVLIARDTPEEQRSGEGNVEAISNPVAVLDRDSDTE